MKWRPRFERLVAELSSHPAITVRKARIGAPTAAAIIANAKAVAGAAWPDGMTDFYSEMSSVDIDYEVAGSEGNGGSIHIPTVTDVWDHAKHEDELWFDWLVAEKPDHPFTRIRPIDRFVPEAYAVLYPVPSRGPATVHYHYCGEDLVPTGLRYERWLELLLRARGAHYWLNLTTGPAGGRTWVEENFDRVAAIFPDFDPGSMSPQSAFEPIES
jgi:hypothetical protein